LREFKQVSGKEFLDMSGLRVRKINKTMRAAIGTMRMVKNVCDNEAIVEFHLYQKQGGEYRKTPYTFPPEAFCRFCDNDIYVWPKILKVLNFPSPMICPLPEVFKRMFKKSS
jgi:hypothetical protein